MTDLDALRGRLEGFAQPKKEKQLSAREERIITGFEEILEFIDEHDRLPELHPEADIFERLWATRLRALKGNTEARVLLQEYDRHGLLAAVETRLPASELSEDELFERLQGLTATPASGLRELRHVRSSAEKRAAEEIASRKPAADFDAFRELFRQVQQDLETGARSAVRFRQSGGIALNELFILRGQVLLVAEMGELFEATNEIPNARLRVIYDNGTESNLLMDSLRRALQGDPAGRRVLSPTPEPLFSGLMEEGDVHTGTIYVLRSNSAEPYIRDNRDLIHKIGVTGTPLKQRFANAANDATFLLADVEVVAEYRLANMSRHAFEKLLHRIFRPAQLDITISDRFGKPVTPREWFLVPLGVIDEAIKRIIDGSITAYSYDPERAELVVSKG